MPRDANAAWRARDFLIDLDLPAGETMDRALLLASEAATFLVRHGAGPQLEMEVRLGGEDMRVEVRDPAGGSERAANDDAEAFAIMIMRDAADAWGITDDGAVGLWFEVGFPPG